LIGEILGEFSRRSQDDNKEMHLLLNSPPDMPRIIGDIERIRQIIQNLVENAYLYTPSGGTVILTLQHIGQFIQIDIQDNGVGILPSDQDRIFQRFFRGEDPLVLASSGTGLGLSIVSHLVELHNGKIWFESSGIAGEGSTFSIILPVYEYASVIDASEEID
jgi:signal transduction histidine kinase